MAKTKDFKVSVVDNQDNYIFSAKKKNAIYLKGISQADIDTSSFKVVDGNLLFSTLDGKNFAVSNYTKVKYIKTDITGTKKTSLFNIISNSLVDNTLNPISNYNSKKLTVSGTNYNDIIDVSLSGYTPKGKTNIKKNKGLTISGGNGHDSIAGTDYNDVIKGGNGDDTIIGGWGNDKLTGGKGNNTFVFSSEDGADTITDAKLGDIIKLEDIDADDLSYYRKKNNLEIYYGYNEGHSENKIVIQNYFKTKNKIDKLIAQDKEIQLSNEAKNYCIKGTGTLKGNNEDNIIESTGKNNVKIYAGKGNDTIYAGAKKSTLYFYEGDGIDTVENTYDDEFSTSTINLVFQAGVRPTLSSDAKIKAGKGGFLYWVRDFIISYGSSEDKVILEGFDTEDLKTVNIKIGNKTYKLNNYFDMPKDMYDNKSDATIEGTDFADRIIVRGNNNTVNAKDGSDYIVLDYDRKNNTVNAGDGDDYIVLEGDENIINAGRGNDYVKIGRSSNTVNSGEGNDTLEADILWGGYSTIYDESGNDDKIILNNTKEDTVFKFDLAIDESGNIIENQSKNMYITSADYFTHPSHGVKVVDQFVEDKAIETIKTSDNYILTTTQINQLRQNVAGWLHTNGFESVQQIINSNNETNISNLIAEFQKANWQEA